jgi:hypothetical protein
LALFYKNVSLLLSLTNNGVCDPGIKDNLDCNYDLPDCENEHNASPTCPFLELHDKLSCQVATGILNTFPKCENLRLCCEKGHLLNNGICNADISGDFGCLYDAEDCQDVGKQNELCQYAMKQSKLGCDIKNKVNLHSHETFAKYTTIQAVKKFFSQEVK